MPADSPRLLCVSLHDVAPATLDDCTTTLAFLDGLGLVPVSLLVVPDYHGLGRADRDGRFASFIESRILRGDEIVLHGYRLTSMRAPCARHSGVADATCLHGRRRRVLEARLRGGQDAHSAWAGRAALRRLVPDRVCRTRMAHEHTGTVRTVADATAVLCDTRCCRRPAVRSHDPGTEPGRQHSFRVASRALADMESSLARTTCDEPGRTRCAASGRSPLPDDGATVARTLLATRRP